MVDASPAPVSVAIHAALDPRIAGGVQTNLVSLARGLADAGPAAKIALLAPDSVVEPWRLSAGDNASVIPWKHVFPWYRESAPKSFRRKLADAIASMRRDRMAERDRELRIIGAQLVHFPYQLGFDTSLPSIYEPWDLQHIHLPDLFSDGEREWRTAMYRRACQRAALVVTATATTKDDIVTNFSIAPEKIAVIKRDSGIKLLPPIPERRRHILRELGITQDFAFYPAMTFAHKNHATLFEALKIASDRHGVTINLVCSGRLSGSQQQAIEEKLAHLQIGRQVQFVGSLSEEALITLFTEARLLAFPSLFEGLGLPLLEAMQFGLPIVASNASCIPEVTAGAAVLFDPRCAEDMAGCLSKVWLDEHLRSELISKGYSRRQDYAWDTATPTFVAAYRKVAGMPLTIEQQRHLARALSQ